MSRLVLLVGLVVVLGFGGCNAIAWKRGQLEDEFSDAGMRRAEARLGDATVSYWDGGADGPPVLLLHGFGASAIWQWHGQIEEIAKQHRVIMPDLLWFGGSSSTRRDFRIDYQVDTVVALMDHLGVKRAHVVGISYGGFVSYELAAAHPQRVDRTVILDSPARTYTRADYAELCERFSVDHIGSVLVPTTTEGVQRLLEIAKFDPDWAPDWVKKQVLEQLYGQHGVEQVALLDGLLAEADTLQARAGRPQGRVLLIWGQQDAVFPLPLAHRLQRHLGQETRLEVIAEAKHAPNLEHPEKVTRLLLEFFGSVGE